MIDRPFTANLDQVDVVEVNKALPYGFKSKRIGAWAKAEMIGCTWYEIPPGKYSLPYHYHTANEEGMFVLEGTGEVEIGDARQPIRAGDYVAFLRGPGGGHSVYNTSEQPLKYLMFSTMVSPDVAHYPKATGGEVVRYITPWSSATLRNDKRLEYQDLAVTGEKSGD